jgi:hypothetical protein
MRRFPVVSVLAALLTAIPLSLLAGCGGGNSANTTVATIVLSPTSFSLNEGGVATLSATAQNSSGVIVAADITFTSSNTNIATVSSGGLICGGVWDANIINCNIGQGGVGQVTITATSGNVTATATVYVHLKVDRVAVNLPSGCTTMGQAVNASATACSASAPGCLPDSECSPNSPCDITSTVGPITIASNDPTIVATSAGIDPTYSSATNSPTYTSGGTITGSAGQTCNLSSFSVGGSGIDPTFSSTTNSPTYTSGGTITGSFGQTCNLSNFNGVTGATATVALTGTNAIASGTPLIVAAEGYGATTPPTTATLSNGTATCTGTANVITTLTSIGTGLSVVGATATVALTGTNTIASATHLTVTSPGYGATVAPDTAMLSNGTASCSGTASVITALTSGVLTAEGPGATTIFGSVSGVNGVGQLYETCRVVQIVIQSSTDSTTSFTLPVGGAQPLTAYVTDSNQKPIAPQLTWASSSNASVTVSSAGSTSATITGVAPGTASITASCAYPVCNRGVSAQYSSDVVTVNVTGSSTTTVYAASTKSLSLVPISTSTNTAGTAITLPYPPNSIISDSAGTTLYLGSSFGLMAVNLASGVVTTYPVNGIVVAISPNGNYLLLSDSVGNVYNFLVSTGALSYTNPGITTTSGAYTPDSNFDAWLSTDQLFVGYPTAFVGPTELGYTPNALDFIAQGGLTYITSSSAQQIHVLATCDQTEVQVLALPANHPTLIKAIPNGTGAVAADSPNIDVISTQVPLNPGCPTPNQSYNQSSLTSVDLRAGSFNAQQLFLSSDSSHAWIISDLPPELLGFSINGSTPLPPILFTGGATAFSGGITLDGSQVYVGTSDGTVHRIDVASGTDVQPPIAVNLKAANGNPVPPDLVYVQPH